MAAKPARKRVRKPREEPSLDHFEPDTDSPLDPGIRQFVLILRSRGVETFESCDGVRRLARWLERAAAWCEDAR